MPAASYGTTPMYNGGAINMPPNSTQPSMPPASSSYPTGAAAPYPSSAASPYPPPATASYPSTGGAPAGYAADVASSAALTAPQNGYPGTTANSYTNPVRPASSYSSSQASGSALGAGASTLDRYSAAAATRGDSVPAGIMADRGSGAGNFAPGSSVPLTGNRYGMPGSTPSSTGSSSYPLSAAADSSAMSSGSAALQSSSPASMGNGAVSTPEYRPGGTGDYLPRGVVTPTSATLPSSASTVGAGASGYGQSTGIQ